MIERAFGSTGRRVPVVGQGTWNVPTRGAARDEALRALRAGIARGMTHVDTAEMYGDGAAEKLIADAIASERRERLFLVSKVLPQNASYEGTIRACEQSLRRLRTEYLDCYLLHWRGSIPLAETLGALERLVADGKIRALGVSNFDVDDLREAESLLARERIACNQILYHLGERTMEAHELPYCRERDIAIVAYTPFGRGEWMHGAGASTLAEVARKYGVGTRAVILAFLCRDETVFTIPKAARTDHVAENAAAGDLRLDAEDVAAIERAFPARRRRGGMPTL